MKKILSVAVVLVLATATAYWPVTGHDFIDFDDDTYVTANNQVRAGLTWDGLWWAFTDHTTNWHPLTWLSHMLDVELFGLNPGWHHGVNLLFHVANAILLFLVLLTLTGKLWPGAAVAGLFALHPLHVESVAWLAERKDVLSAFFWFLAMLAYGRYVRRPKAGWYLPVVLVFALGLMAKPMIITLPLVLLLLDYWPLGRFARTTVAAGGPVNRRPLRLALRLFLEKLPLLALSAASAVITYHAQFKGGAVVEALHIPLALRLNNAVISYWRYLIKTIWPGGLSVFYPFPVRDLPLWQVASALATLVIVTVVCLRGRTARPYLAVGWLWFAVTLVPVLGVVQVGAQAMADRYTYLPLVGLFIAAIWGGAGLLPDRRLPSAWPPLAMCTVLGILMTLTWFQVGFWKDTITLFSHTVEVTPDNDLAHLNLGSALFEQGRTDEAISHFREVLRIDPRAEDGHNNLGAALFKQGKTEEALGHFREALRLCPDFAKPYDNIGIVLLTQGRAAAAARYIATARVLREKGDSKCRSKESGTGRVGTNNKNGPE